MPCCIRVAVRPRDSRYFRRRTHDMREISEKANDETTEKVRINTTPLHNQAHIIISIPISPHHHMHSHSLESFSPLKMRFPASQREFLQPPPKADVFKVSVTPSPLFFQRCVHVNHIRTRAVVASRDPTDRVSSMARPNTVNMVLLDTG